MKIIITDDHALFREGISLILQNLDEQLTLIEAKSINELMLHLKNHHDADCLLMDLYMPGKNAFDAIGDITTQYPTIPIIILSASNNQDDMHKVIQLGAMGYINKDSSSKVMINAIQLVLAGEIYMPAKMMQVKGENSSHLTPRQQAVLDLMAEGLSNKLIADKLCISEPTVKMHISAIFRFLGVSNRTQAVLKANELKTKQQY